MFRCKVARKINFKRERESKSIWQKKVTQISYLGTIIQANNYFINILYLKWSPRQFALLLQHQHLTVIEITTNKNWEPNWRCGPNKITLTKSELHFQLKLKKIKRKMVVGGVRWRRSLFWSNSLSLSSSNSFFISCYFEVNYKIWKQWLWKESNWETKDLRWIYCAPKLNRPLLIWSMTSTIFIIWVRNSRSFEFVHRCAWFSIHAPLTFAVEVHNCVKFQIVCVEVALINGGLRCLDQLTIDIQICLICVFLIAKRWRRWKYILLVTEVGMFSLEQLHFFNLSFDLTWHISPSFRCQNWVMVAWGSLDSTMPLFLWKMALQ